MDMENQRHPRLDQMREYQRRKRAEDHWKARESSRRAYAARMAKEDKEPLLRARRKALGLRWRLENRDYLNEYARELYYQRISTPDGLEAVRAQARAAMRRYKASPANRPKMRARWRAASALRRGVLERQPCQACGSELANMHHPDYAKPLKVVWLCRKHHGHAHRSP